MDNYNPRQNTRMRWRAAKELEKFMFISGAFNFQNETLEHVSQDKLYSKLVEVINDSRPVLVYDTINFELSIGNVDSGTMYLTTLYNNTGISYTLTYDEETDKLRIEAVEENFLSEDNVKTLFGTQSIIGDGNIDLFRHQLILTNTNDVSVSYIIESSNNLPIDSPQDFVTVTKADTDYTGHGLYLDANNNIQPAFIRYSAGNVIIQLQNGSLAPLKSVKDKVTTI